MSMHDPLHPGEFIKEVYMEPFGLTVRKVARNLKVAPSTFVRLLNCQSNVTPEMALRLSYVFGRTPESWLAMQDHYSLWHARQKVDMRDVKKLELAAV
ncbi:MAG: HigA family addiction module antidote protein [Candidatus Marinimicrobia bacterium]|nr:HigA family addiction module antidote protein [Candidatus Neomarinimicrobiota bacterium]